MIEKGDLTEISKPIFSTGDVYLIDDEKTIYIWIGSKQLAQPRQERLTNKEEGLQKSLPLIKAKRVQNL